MLAFFIFSFFSWFCHSSQNGSGDVQFSDLLCIQEVSSNAVLPAEDRREISHTSIQSGWAIMVQKEPDRSHGSTLAKGDAENIDQRIPRPKTAEIIAETEVGHGDVSSAPDHQLFNQLLNTYVDEKGKVNYQGFKSDLGKLEQYLEILQKNAPSADWRRNQKLAYWINVYNAFTIKLILDHYPIASITSLENGKPWDKKWIKIGETTYSLNQVENEIIRPQFGDPRIHFAVNCAAKSCPPLANRAFTENNLEQLLEQQTRNFINDHTFNDLSTSQASLSKIFEWYASDFGDLVSFINKYSLVKLKPSSKITYQEYNWDLNKF